MKKSTVLLMIVAGAGAAYFISKKYQSEKAAAQAPTNPAQPGLQVAVPGAPPGVAIIPGGGFWSELSDAATGAFLNLTPFAIPYAAYKAYTNAKG